jgi:ATP-dependent DNA helicase RecQ
MPKSIEHYQQETGRAGRDGLPSECILFFTVGDWITLRKITESSLIEAGAPGDIIAASKKQLEEMANYCRTPKCRHRALVEYFGQSYEQTNCNACDICLGDTDTVPDAKIIAQKVMSCVVRIGERFGVNYLVDVLVGSRAAEVLNRKHDQLSTHGILKEISKSQLRDWVYQLVGQDLLLIDGGEYPIVKLGPQARGVLHGDAEPRLIRTVTKSEHRKQSVRFEATAHADMTLFEELRNLRKEISRAAGVPPYIVFTDNVLLEMSANRPSSEEKMLAINGIGATKMGSYGPRFLEAIRDYCDRTDTTQDVAWRTKDPTPTPNAVRLTGTKSITIPLLKQRFPLDEIAAKAGVTVGTVANHLSEWIQTVGVDSIDVWVPRDIQMRVLAAADVVGRDKLTPIYEHLQQQIGYDMIRIVLAYESQNAAPSDTAR